MIKQATPYLMFDGTAQAAIDLYQAALGAKVEGLQRFGDIPGHTVAPENKDRVMHAMLQLGTATIMVSDSQPGSAIQSGESVRVALQFDDPAELRAAFDKLAEGGDVFMPVELAFWGDHFGMLTDRFGIRWMCSAPATRA